MWWCSPLLCSQFPEGLILKQFFCRQPFSSFFIPAIQRTIIDGVFLNPNDCHSTSFTVLKTVFSLFSHPKLPLYLSYPPLLLILMLLLISSDIHPNPGPIDPCSICSHRVTWRNRLIQCTNCPLWAHLSCSGLSLTYFCKISSRHPWTCPMCPPSSQTSPHSHNLTLYLHLQTPTKPHLQKRTPQNNFLPLITPLTILITPN